MGRPARTRLALSLCAHVLLMASVAVLGLRADLAAAQPEADEPAGEDARLEEAKQLFYQGNEMRQAGDYERALDYYRRSQALVPAVPNIMNSAVCLSNLGRTVEALAMYEQLLTGFRGELTDEQRKAIQAAVRELQPKVARLVVRICHAHGQRSF